MTNKKILPTLLRVNIFTLSIIFLSVVFYNVYLALMIRSFDKVSTGIHDIADLSQYAISLVLQKKSLRQDESPSEIIESTIRFEEDLKIRLKNRKSDFVEVYSEQEYEEFIKNVAVMINLTDYIKNENIDRLLDMLEESYVAILQFSAKHHDVIDDFFITKLQLLVASFILLILLILGVLVKRIKSIIYPLKEITHLSENLTIAADGNNEISFKKNYGYYEYQVLMRSLEDMHRRIHYENRMKAHESASESVGHFAENLAHSINNPLAIIATSIKMLNKFAKKSDNQLILSETNQVLDEIQRITDITHKMKSLINSSSKSEAENFKAFNLITTINLLFFNRLFEKNIQFFYDKDIDLVLFGKEEIISQIIVTLVENSIKYCDADKPKIELIFEDQESCFFVHVRDNGSAPSESFMEKNMSGKVNTQSLGLFTANKSADENGYKLEYFSSPIKEFILTIPKKEKSEKSSIAV